MDVRVGFVSELIHSNKVATQLAASGEQHLNETS